MKTLLLALGVAVACSAISLAGSPTNALAAESSYRRQIETLLRQGKDASARGVVAAQRTNLKDADEHDRAVVEDWIAVAILSDNDRDRTTAVRAAKYAFAAADELLGRKGKSAEMAPVWCNLAYVAKTILMDRALAVGQYRAACTALGSARKLAGADDSRRRIAAEIDRIERAMAIEKRGRPDK